MTDGVFQELREISALSRTAGNEGIGRDRLIRFLDRYSFSGPEVPVVDSLCARYGLYPYMSATAGKGASEALALEFHTPESLAGEGFTFHAMQQHVFNRLMDGESVVLSAPTSFGKSAILDALIASNRWSNMVVIVPTIALIDETRRRLARFRSEYTLVTQSGQAVGERNIYILTQERFLEFESVDVDFFVIDEFYKLGSNEKFDQRRALLNIAWHRLKSSGAQYYLIGPNIDRLDEGIGQDVRGRFIHTDFRTVAVDVEDRSSVPVEEQLTDLLRFVEAELDESTLFFTGSPEKAERLALNLCEVVPDPPEDGLAALVAQWLGENYDEQWNIVKALARGVGVHTGPLPRSIQRMMVRLFNEGMIGHLVCTSTLIEGVNTAARNVVVFEKKIDNQLLDFFTFSNIRGRAGRMFRHFVGRVVTYSAPPDEGETVVDIPIESQSDLASLATLVQLDRDELGESAMARAQHIFDQNVLSIETIRRNRGLDPELQIELAERLSESPETVRDLAWTGVPSAPQLRRALKLAFDELLEGRQRRGVNFNMVWGQLQNARANGWDFRAMVDQQTRYARAGQDRSDVIRDVLKFSRNWMGFTIPSMLRGLQSVQAEIAGDAGLPAANYEYVLRQVESFYLPPGVVELEEYGVPTPLAIKLTRMGMQGADAQELMESLLERTGSSHVLSNLGVVEQWILADVVRGYAGPSHPLAMI